jgi:hypothetical protein
MSRLAITDAHVAHERLDDEVVVINLHTGAYYALDGPSADCWTLLAAGTPVATTAGALADRFGAAHEAVQPAVERIAAQLVDEGLAQWDTTAAAEKTAAEAELPPLAPGANATAVDLKLEKYDDMEELLLLDPIHEVDEAGWPTLPAETA